MRNIKLTIEYKGTNYHGWQRQKGQNTVQGTIEKALTKITGSPASLIASGRTDAGVHALGQVANFYTTSNIPLEGLKRGLNSILPQDIVILAAEDVPPTFHAIRSSLLKIYYYQVVISSKKEPFWADRAWVVSSLPSLSLMKKAAAHLMGTKDFKAFQASGSHVQSTVRTVYYAHISREKYISVLPEAQLIIFTIAADGFLRYMVRNIVGLLIQIGLGVREPEDINKVLAARDRSRAGPTAPPQGLYLKKVCYAKEDIPFAINMD